MSNDLTLACRVFSCIDNTTLSATDNDESVEAFCRRTMEMNAGVHVAAVCVYPRFVSVARKALPADIHVASVAGAFPHGQLPLSLRVEEVKYAVGEGADEVDIVINRGLLLSGEDNAVRDEVASMKEACGERLLKVILETGELPSPTLIARASQLAIDGGADFIKTSTGKIGTGATPEAASTMLKVIAQNVKMTGKKIGFKAAGGLSTPEDAFAYANIAEKFFGNEYIDKHTFRIGTSKVTEKLFSILA